MAQHNTKDGFIFSANRKVDLINRTMLEVMFDEQVAYDIKDIEANILETKALKRLCFIKIILFPVEYPLMRLLLHRQMSSSLLYCQKVYWEMLRNKITIQTFKRKMKQYL